jgi:hypothetical protein
MKCENLQFNLPLYLDDILTGEERAVVEEHLLRCPLCRQKLTDFQSIRNNLRVLARPELPENLLVSVRTRVLQEVKSSRREPSGLFTRNFREWLQMRFMPYGVGTVTSLFLGFALLWTLLFARHAQQNNEFAKYEPFTNSGVLLANANPKLNSGEFDLSAVDFAAARLSVSSDSPTINPQGALVALTKSFVRGKMKDDEVVVVADVFGDGLAQIAEVVEPSSDRYAVRELEQALKNNPAYAPPFVPAKLDQRSDTVRVVFKIQSVNVNTHLKTRKN